MSSRQELGQSKNHFPPASLQQSEDENKSLTHPNLEATGIRVSGEPAARRCRGGGGERRRHLIVAIPLSQLQEPSACAGSGELLLKTLCSFQLFASWVPWRREIGRHGNPIIDKTLQPRADSK